MLNPIFIEKCFGANYIGIKGYCDDASSSGYFINDEVSITKSAIAKLASADDVRSINFIDRLQRNAIRDTCSDFLDYLNKYGKYISKSITSSKEVYNDLSEQRVVKEVGAYMSIRLDYVKVPQAVTLYIDVDGVRESISLASGVNSINKIIIGEAISLHFNADNAIINMIDIPDKRYYFSSEIKADDTVSELTGEVKFRISSLCSFEKLICENKHLLSRAIFYHTVGLFFKERLNSTRIDPFISNTKEESEDLYREYLYGFEDKKSKYHEALIYAVGNLTQTIIKNYCFICSGVEVRSLI